MYRENGKPVFPSIRSMIRQAESIGREIADRNGLNPSWNHVPAWQDPRFEEVVNALGYGAAIAIVQASRDNRAAELELTL